MSVRVFKLTIIIVSIVTLLLALRFWLYYESLPVYTNGQKAEGVFWVISDPEIVGGRQIFRVRDDHGIRISITTGLSDKYFFGHKLFIRGIFTKKEYKDTFFLSMYYPDIQMLHSEYNFLTKSANWIRNRAKNTFNQYLKPNYSSLLLGIIFGGKHGMSEAFEKNLRVTGVLHVIAASGANVAFVAGALIGVLGALMKRQFAVVLSGFGVIFYMFLAGFEESIVRAGIMAILAFGASIMGRQYLGIVSLVITFCLMLFHNPSLLDHVGFQLSFLATLGILVVKPVLDGALGVARFRGLGQDFTTTFAAQAGILPVILGTFGEIGALSVLVNVLVLWTIPVLMTFGAMAILAGLVFEPLAQLVLYLCLPFLMFFEYAVTIFGDIGWIWGVERFSWQMSVGYYLIIVSLVLLFRKRQSVRVNAHSREKSLRDDIGL